MRLLAAILLLAAAGGCAREGVEGAALPAPCEQPAAAWVRALESAPHPVRVDGVPISDCLGKDSSAGDVQLVGSMVVEAARQLGEERRPVALGYLVGALRRGSERTQGIHAEIVRRVEQEAGPLARLPAFDRGRSAGRSSG